MEHRCRRKGEWLDRRLYADVTAFYMKREDMQISTGVQPRSVGDPGGYFFLTVAAAAISASRAVRWRLTRQWSRRHARLLRTRYYGYRPAGEDLSGRDQAHAPEYQASLNATWRHPLGWMARIDVSAVDDFYFDVPPNPTRSDAYSLTNIKVGYEAALERVRVGPQRVRRGLRRARVLLRQRAAAVRDQRYVQLGEPQQFGVTARWEFR